ncbi:stage III sporulation protein AA [Limnochorda pilosa]|uniref:Stage III sporulation protein AA n=1 Tax=Limnochorda pilosa TaxID=1555112 RepID=A0A0K2SN58_LIMPI|nr:stage III sporulation protein AA [Limnochorda pilosa]BAS28437.1 stage III sporulation protein AA [Limnochorda pilosa]
MRPLLPPSVRNLLPLELERRVPLQEPPGLGALVELRLGEGRPVELCFTGASRFLDPSGELTTDAARAWIAGDGLCQRLLQRVAQGSVYALEEELCQGFVTLPGGHRLGLAGQVVASERGHRLAQVTAANLRIARELVGAAELLLDSLQDHGLLPPWPSLLLVGPPGSGKTTLLRDLVRRASEGCPERQVEGMRVGLVDERSEVAACHRGVPRNRVGPRTDVLDRARKAVGLMQLVRTMDPQLVATDEIGSEEDARAVLEAREAGVAVLVTAHAGSLEELAARPGLQPLLAHRAFEAVCVLGRHPRPGTLVALHPRPHIPARSEYL